MTNDEGKEVSGELAEDGKSWTTTENLGYGRFAVHVTEGRFTLDERAVSGLPMSHLYYDTFAVHGIKEDTDLYETPLTFYADHSGRIAGFHITLEPKVADIDFHKLQ